MSEYLRNQIVQKMLGEPKQSPARMPPARQVADTQPSSGSGPFGAAEVDAANALGAAYYQYPGYFKKGQGGLAGYQREKLAAEFGWSPEGMGKYEAALRAGPLNGLAAWGDSRTASAVAPELNVPECAPGNGYARANKRPHNDCRDAFRHAYWSALMAQRDEEDAAMLGDAYERSSKGPYAEVYMDLYNNRVGRRIGSANKDASGEQIFDLVADELEKRRLITSPFQALKR
ncbi:hypothetical protein GOL81_14700 [Sinorhizobium medicae]|nr:hypothetical protein [Sinorhizobium medicae]